MTDFYHTRRWRWLIRPAMLVFYGLRCRKCGGIGDRLLPNSKRWDPIQVDHVFARARGKKGKALQWKWWNLQLMHRDENLEKGTRFEDYRYEWVKHWFPIEDKPW